MTKKHSHFFVLDHLFGGKNQLFLLDYSPQNKRGSENGQLLIVGIFPESLVIFILRFVAFRYVNDQSSLYIYIHFFIISILMNVERKHGKVD